MQSAHAPAHVWLDRLTLCAIGLVLLGVTALLVFVLVVLVVLGLGVLFLIFFGGFCLVSSRDVPGESIVSHGCAIGYCATAHCAALLRQAEPKWRDAMRKDWARVSSLTPLPPRHLTPREGRRAPPPPLAFSCGTRPLWLCVGWRAIGNRIESGNPRGQRAGYEDHRCMMGGKKRMGLQGGWLPDKRGRAGGRGLGGRATGRATLRTAGAARVVRSVYEYASRRQVLVGPLPVGAIDMYRQMDGRKHGRGRGRERAGWEAEREEGRRLEACLLGKASPQRAVDICGPKYPELTGIHGTARQIGVQEQVLSMEPGTAPSQPPVAKR